MEFTADILQKVKAFGALGYNAERIARLLGIPPHFKEDFFLQFNDLQSPVSEAYQQGIAIGDYNLDAALMKKAETGDVFAIQELKERQEARELRDDLKLRFG